MSHAPDAHLSGLNRRLWLAGLGLTALAGAQLALAQTPPSDLVRVRGSLLTVSADQITVRTRAGETVTLKLSPQLLLSEVYPITLKEIRAGSFIGTAALPQPDGRLKAIAITLFPESARGLAEGHRPFDLQADSTMTNATVADVMSAPTGQTLELRYTGGEKTLDIPADTPVVSFRTGDRSLLVPGASVSLSARLIDGQPTALRINAGRDGFQLPY